MNFHSTELSAINETVLLTLYKKQRYGLEIIEMVSLASNGWLQINVGTLYPLLHKLEKEGLIQSLESDESLQTRGGHLRKYYLITEAGRQALLNAENVRLRLRLWNDGLQPST